MNWSGVALRLNWSGVALRLNWSGVALQGIELSCSKSAREPRGTVERWVNLWRAVLLHQKNKGGCGFQAALLAEALVPTVSNGHMSYFVTQDDVEDRGSRVIAMMRKPLAHAGRDIEAARFEDARHQGHAHQHIVTGFPGHVPQAVVRREVTVGVAVVRLQMLRQQGEVSGLFLGHIDPVAVVIVRHVREAAHCVEREVDGVELDVGDGVDQRRAARGRAEAAARHGGRMQQCRLDGTPR